MRHTVIQIDYSDICVDYNTVYLDRDNTDPETLGCMRKAMAWTRAFLEELAARFGFGFYYMNSGGAAAIDDIASRRFLFFSLEKGITVQHFVFRHAPAAFDSLQAWENGDEEGMLVHNDEDGEGIFLRLAEGSELHRWVRERLAALPSHGSAGQP